MQVNNKNKLIVECECGCGSALSFSFEEGFVYIDVLESYYYAEQRSIRNIIADKVRLLGSDRWISSIDITKEDVLKIMQFLKSHKCSSEEVSNNSYVRLSCTKAEGDASAPTWYNMTVYCTMPRHQVLLGKAFRAGEIVVNEKLRRKILNHVETVLKKASLEGARQCKTDFLN